MWVEILICAVLTVVGFASGVCVGWNASPKEIKQTTLIDSQSQTEVKTDTRQTTMQGQVTIIFNGNGEKTEYINVNLKDFTNISVQRYSNSNHIIVTNTNVR